MPHKMVGLGHYALKLLALPDLGVIIDFRLILSTSRVFKDTH